MDREDDWEDFTAEDIEILDSVEKDMKNSRNLNEPALTQSTQFDMMAEFSDDHDEPQMEHLECLRSKFFHNAFRSKQWDIIRSMLYDNRDVCAVMATGYGKSLCFQFPAVYTNGMTLVISPLIALMQAQVIDLKKAGISACLVGSAQKDCKILEKIADRKFTVVYSSPEYLQTARGDQLLSILKEKLTLIAIDEAHCVSQWGHDFRPDFRKLHKVREKIPDTPILAVTATATENVRYDIINLLKLREPRVIMTSFDRSNLEFVVQQKTSYKRDLPPRIRNVDGSVIVYVLKRKEAEDIADGLRKLGIDCAHYHAGLDIEKRTEVLEQFLNDELKVIVATNAFGMGIDKRDIRLVIHYGACKNIEAYYQEVGRAGRDGRYAKVITFFDLEDFVLHDWFLDEQERKDGTLSPVIKNYLRSLGAKMRDFLYSTQCRRKTILEYFGEDVTILTPRPNCCDNCNIGLCSWKLTDLYENVDDNGTFDFATDAKILLVAIECLARNEISTEKDLIKKFLIGKYDQRLRAVQCERSYASGRMNSDQYWVALTEQLSSNGFIDVKVNSTKLQVSAKGEEWLANSTSLPLKAIGQMYHFFSKKDATPLIVGSNKPNRQTVTRAVSNYIRKSNTLTANLLKEILIKVRDAIAAKNDVTENEMNSIATLVAFDKMVKVKPQNLDEFRYATLDGFNEAKINKYGPTFVNVISKFVKGELEMQNILLNNPMPNISMDRIVSPQVLQLLKEKKSKSDIIQLTRLNEDQLYSDFETLIKTGQPVLKTDLATINEIDFNAFSQCINEQDFDIQNVNEIMLRNIQKNYNKSTNHQIGSGFTKLVLVYHEVRSHLNNLNLPYVDCDGSILINGQNLIVKERNGTLNTTFETEHQYPPFRRNNNALSAQLVMDLLFGDCVSCDTNYHHDYDYDYDSDQLEYEPAEFNGYDAPESDDETNDGSGESGDGESDEGSDQLEYEPAEFNGYDTPESDDESNDGSDDRSDEGSEEENDGSDNESEERNDSEGHSDNSDSGSDNDSQEISSGDESSNDVEDGSNRRMKRRRISN